MSIVKLNNNGVKNATAFGSITGLGNMVFIKKITASSSATVSFVDGSSDVVLDDTYKEYLFTFNNIHPQTNLLGFLFNGSDDNSSHSYDIAKTTTLFYARHKEDGSSGEMGYDTSRDLAQGIGFQYLNRLLSNDADGSLSGYLHLFDPSNTTFVKHFISVTNEMNLYGDSSVGTHNVFTGGYFNTTAAITAIQFKMESGNIDAGDICLYGIV